ncbi:UTP--glucose-1-phosphate uridylyltransferase GalU [Ornithinibacillus contaminans]|uniref:UTP--glucose-1-phosphate uridylyltransferase GalU n=1 Tax=Ornithinibacillus contaminans TaxID=694055 RepID=UPI00064D8C3E|nr:UTP--glucose-1-phosphate uridylyltransferase GalU [Ornithinibacillus contaminans]
MIKKAVIPAAGLGTRFLPATKAMPKEMLPIVDKPTIQYIIEEAIESGIEDIIIVTGKGKRAIEDHFDYNHELEDNLIKKEKYELLEKIKSSSSLDIHYIRQKEPLGLGHAIWCARKFIGDEPFGVLLGDDIVQAKIPALKQLIQQYETFQSPILGVKSVGENETERYGIVDPGTKNGNTYKLNSLIEKPKKGTAPSKLAIMGRYILTPEIFNHLERFEKGSGGEIQLTDAIAKYLENSDVYAYEFQGKHFDVGEKLGFVKTTIDFALNNPEIQEEVRRYIKEIALRDLVIR